jgi:hypothetical protein
MAGADHPSEGRSLRSNGRSMRRDAGRPSPRHEVVAGSASNESGGHPPDAPLPNQRHDNRAFRRTGWSGLRYEPGHARFGALGYFMAKRSDLPCPNTAPSHDHRVMAGWSRGRRGDDRSAWRLNASPLSAGPAGAGSEVCERRYPPCPTARPCISRRADSPVCQLPAIAPPTCGQPAGAARLERGPSGPSAGSLHSQAAGHFFEGPHDGT